MVSGTWKCVARAAGGLGPQGPAGRWEQRGAGWQWEEVGVRETVGGGETFSSKERASFPQSIFCASQ